VEKLLNYLYGHMIKIKIFADFYANLVILKVLRTRQFCLQVTFYLAFHLVYLSVPSTSYFKLMATNNSVAVVIKEGSGTNGRVF